MCSSTWWDPQSCKFQPPIQCNAQQKILRKGRKWNWTHCKTSYYRLHAWIEMKLTEIGDLPVACCWTADSPPNPEDKEGLHWCFLQICRLRSELKTLSVGTLPWPANNYYEMQLENMWLMARRCMIYMHACLSNQDLQLAYCCSVFTCDHALSPWGWGVHMPAGW